MLYPVTLSTGRLMGEITGFCALVLSITDLAILAWINLHANITTDPFEQPLTQTEYYSLI